MIISYLLYEIFKVQMGCYPSIKSVLKEDYFFIKALEGRTPDYPSEKLLSLKYHNSHDNFGVAVCRANLSANVGLLTSIINGLPARETRQLSHQALRLQ